MIKSKLTMIVFTVFLGTIVSLGGFLINNNKHENNYLVNATKEESEESFIEEDVIKNDNDEDITKEENNKENTNSSNDAGTSKEELDNQSEGLDNSSNNNNSNNETSISSDSNAPTYEQSQETNPPKDTEASKAPTNKQVISESNYILGIEQAIFQRTNQERTAAGLQSLSYNTTMEYYARIKSSDMGDNGYFDHADLQGELMNEQIQADGISYRAWGENIAYIQGLNDHNALSTRFMDNWMNSEGHKANILSSNFSSIGIGVYKIGDTYYATQEFYN